MPTSSRLAKLSAKQQRVLVADVALLFSSTAFMRNVSIEEIRRLGPWHPTLRLGRKAILLSKRGIEARARVEAVLLLVPELSDTCSKREISSQVWTSYEFFISQMLEPNAEELVDHVADALLAQVKWYQFLALVSGVDLKDVPSVELGSFRIQRASRALLEPIQFGDLGLDAVYDRFKDSFWLIGRVHGGPEVAEERFRHSSVLCVGLLALYGAVTRSAAFTRTRVNAAVPQGAAGVTPQLRWDPDGSNPWVSLSSGPHVPLPLTAESLSYLNEHCLFQQLAGLMDRADTDELQKAILTALYWLSEAYRDAEPTMRLVKLWSSMECFFSIEKEGLTELNARGIAAILAHGGYRVISHLDYSKVKTRLKKLYGLRSQAVHRGKFGHVGQGDLSDFSQWVAWVIISMMALSERGYRTLRSVHLETGRFDGLHAPKS